MFYLKLPLFLSFIATSLVFAQRPKISPIWDDPIEDRKRAVPLCGLTIQNPVLDAQQDYCKLFSSEAQAVDNHVFCVTAEGKDICYFPNESGVFGKGTFDRYIKPLPVNFYKQSPNLADIARFMKEANQKITADDVLTKMVFVHPLRTWLERTKSGRRLLENYFLTNRSEMGLVRGAATYYEFIEQTEPYRSVARKIPGFIQSPVFWDMVQKNSIQFSKDQQTSPAANPLNLIGKHVLPIKEVVTANFGETPFLFYPIHSQITADGTQKPYRLMVYYEEEINDHWWGRSMIIPFDSRSLTTDRMVTFANYDLDSKKGAHFFYEFMIHFENSQPTIANRSRVGAIENCHSCHFKMNKPKIGSMNEHPPENGPFYPDFKDAFVMYHPLSGRLSDKSAKFKNKGGAYFFPSDLHGRDEQGVIRDFHLYDLESFGPLLGNNDTPLSNQCFNEFPTIADDINCYSCHNNREDGTAGISKVNFSTAMNYLEPSPGFFTNSFTTKTHGKLARELFMPYGLYRIGTSQNAGLSQEELKKLANCLKLNFPKDQENWFWNQINSLQ